MNESQLTLFDDNAEYDAFTEKFVPKKTTDDCYTPANVYRAVSRWVAAEYGLDEARFLRPFKPGGDYEREDYPDSSVVVDNPPFSILSRIYDFYILRNIRFFLFAPTLSLFSAYKDLTYIPCGVKITYENGANINTSFVTNLDSCRLRSAPALYESVRRENDENEKKIRKQNPKYCYPNHLLTAAAAYQYSHYGIDFRLEKTDCAFVRALDAQRNAGKAVFGGGLLLSDQAAEERAAAEQAVIERSAAMHAEREKTERQAKITWELSGREREIIKHLGGAL